MATTTSEEGFLGDWNRATLVVGAVSLALLFGMERFVKKSPQP